MNSNFSEILSQNNNPEDSFALLELLGEGSYGSVYKALHKETGQLFAIKIIPFTPDSESLFHEINIMRQCKSEYIVQYFGSYLKENCLWLIMEYCSHGSIIDFLKTKSISLTETVISTILLSVLKGLEYLHRNKKIHRDIKAANILLDVSGSVKLADFGVSAELLNTFADKDTVIGTPFWMSPEVISKSKYNKKTDIWSLGITAIELAEGQPPYSNIHPVRAMFAIKSNPPQGLSQPNKWSNEFNSFVRKCLIIDPKKRPNTKELLIDPFILKKAKNQSFLCNFLNGQYEKMDKIDNGFRIEKKKIVEKIDFKEDDKLKFINKNENGTMITYEDEFYNEDFKENKPYQANLSHNDTGTMLIKDSDSTPIKEEISLEMIRTAIEELKAQRDLEINQISKKYNDVIKQYEIIIKDLTHKPSKSPLKISNNKTKPLIKPQKINCFENYFKKGNNLSSSSKGSRTPEVKSGFRPRK